MSKKLIPWFWINISNAPRPITTPIKQYALPVHGPMDQNSKTHEIAEDQIKILTNLPLEIQLRINEMSSFEDVLKELVNAVVFTLKHNLLTEKEIWNGTNKVSTFKYPVS